MISSLLQPAIKSLNIPKVLENHDFIYNLYMYAFMSVLLDWMRV